MARVTERKTAADGSGLFPARRVAVRMHYTMVMQFVALWAMRGRPCDLDIRRSKRDRELIGVCLSVAGDDTIELLVAARNELRLDIVDL